MDHKELLIQIEEMLDRKLEEKLEQKLEEKLDKKLDEKLKPINDRLTSVEQKVDSLEVKVDSMDCRLTAVEEDLTSVKKTCFRVENEVIPRLDTLYEDRISHAEFNRLSERVDKNTGMLLVMKDVIIDHSGDIQHLKKAK